jgi:hypothetical protein
MANEEKLEAFVKRPAQGKDDTTLAGKLSKDEREEFARKLLARLSEQAFGAMSKRELELFIFHLLSNAEKLRSLSTYEWANLLHISESRIRSLRADSALRFVPSDNQAALTEIAMQFCAKGKETCMEYDEKESRIKLLLDDPRLQREFEYSVRALGRIPDYRFNRNILDVPATTFVAVFVENFPKQKKKFEEAFKALVKADEEYQKVIDGAKSWSEQFEAICEKHKAKIEMLTKLIGVVLPGAVGAAA